MRTVAYYVAVSMIYLLLNIANAQLADALVVAFIALLMIPACYGEYRRVRGRH